MPHLTDHVLQRGRLLLTKALVPAGSEMRERLSQLPSARLQGLFMYKQFFKLRHLMGGGSDTYSKPQYVSQLRRAFQRRDFREKRSVFLPKSLPALLDQEMLERGIATLAFVFNATVAVTSGDQKEPLDYKATPIKGRETMEQQVIRTMLRVEHGTPAKILQDYQYRWINAIESDDAVAMGLKQYHTTLMRLNETMGLCL